LDEKLEALLLLLAFAASVHIFSPAEILCIGKTCAVMHGVDESTVDVNT